MQSSNSISCLLLLKRQHEKGVVGAENPAPHLNSESSDLYCHVCYVMLTRLRYSGKCIHLKLGLNPIRTHLDCDIW